MGGVLLAAGAVGGGVPAACFAALAPNLPMKFGPEPPSLFASPERGAEPP